MQIGGANEISGSVARDADVTEVFTAGNGCLAIRPVDDFGDYACDGRCRECPVGIGSCSISSRRRRRNHEHQDIPGKQQT